MADHRNVPGGVTRRHDVAVMCAHWCLTSAVHLTGKDDTGRTSSDTMHRPQGVGHAHTLRAARPVKQSPGRTKPTAPVTGNRPLTLPTDRGRPSDGKHRSVPFASPTVHPVSDVQEVLDLMVEPAATPSRSQGVSSAPDTPPVKLRICDIRPRRPSGPLPSGPWTAAAVDRISCGKSACE